MITKTHPLAITLREVIKSDASEIANINTTCWKTTYRGLIDNTFLDNLSLTPARVAHFQDGIIHKQIYFCAVSKGKILGYLNGGKTRNNSLPYPFEIYCLYVHPDYQGCGIGTCLIQEFKKRIGNNPFCVYMLDGNHKALAFYKKCGGIRCPRYDTDTVVYRQTTHDLLLAFNEKDG